MSPKFDVFLVQPKPIPSFIPGFEGAVGQATWPPSTSTLISDGGESVLVDCLVTQNEARELAAWVKSLGQQPSYVYITHPHGDHPIGLPEILEAFPNAQPVALAESMAAMQEQISPEFMQIWSAFFPGQVTSAPVVPGPLPGDTLRVGGTEINLVPVGGSDAEHSTVVHVPALDLVVSGDVVYNRTHMWFYLSTPESRANWAKALDAVAALDVGTLIAGHRNPAAPDDDAHRQISESQQYLANFEQSLARSSTPTELIDRVTSAYPDWANPYTVWFAAYNLLGNNE
jgi:glyoxylase-like metal-dependent hydrolase (beta-lactamase superfamily II)